MSEVLRLQCITKEFPRVVAAKNVDFDLKKGEVHALLGENGAGKSTLMNCVCGLCHPTSGEIFINGRKVSIDSCTAAVDYGIGMVHQHFMLVPELTVAENVILGLKRKNDFFINLEKVEQEVAELSEKYHFGIDPKARVRDLPVGMQQRVEILKIIYRKAEIIILDEATAVLTPQESEELFHIVEMLVEKGKSVVLITHKLSEVMRMADRVTVLRDGQVVGTVNRKDTDKAQLARMMVGRDVLFDFSREKSRAQEVLMEVRDLSVLDGRGVEKVRDLSFSLHAGEILGVAGVDGNGQLELSEALTGMAPFRKGSIRIRSREYRHLTTRECYRNRVSHIPQDRQHTGLIMERSIERNLILTDYRDPRFSSRGFLRNMEIRKNAVSLMEKFRIKAPGASASVCDLSGGNQQKVILAREISRGPEILIAVQPSRGLDIGATEFVRQQLINERDRGTAVLLISTELDEILQIADRIAVIYKGEFMGILENHDISVQEVGMMMAGVRHEED